jgi:WD40 repeat protein
MQGPLLEISVSDGWATGVLMLPDGGFLTTGVDPYVKQWDANGVLLRTLAGHEKSVDALALHPDGQRLLTGSVDATARLWDTHSGEPLAVLVGHKKTVAAVAVTPDGMLGVTGSYDRTIRLWDLESGTSRAVLKGHPNNVVSTRVSPDGSLLASGGVGTELRLWTLPTGELLKVVSHAHDGAVVVSGFTPDGTRLVTIGADNLLAVRGVPELEEHWSVSVGAGGTHQSSISPDGRLIAVTVDHAVRVIDLETGAAVDELPFEVKGVYGVSFSADGTVLATATADSFLRTWSLA